MPRVAKEIPLKNCETCGTILVRKRFNKTLEDFTTFLRRRFCSLSCANSRDKGGDSETRCRIRAQEFKGDSCEACGSVKNLHAHHVNCNWSDNRKENIQTLCESCHHSWHARHLVHGLQPMTRMPWGSRHLPILCREAVPQKKKDRH